MWSSREPVPRTTTPSVLKQDEFVFPFQASIPANFEGLLLNFFLP